MLSEKENKAIKELIEIKELSEEDLKFDDYEVTAILDKTDLKSLIIVLNLIENLIFKTETQKELLKYKTDKIEKQSKEIEELKNGQIDFWISDKEIEERIRNKFVSKDKIKAKIEELDDLNSPFAQRVINGKEVYLTEMIQNILQSLLEKE